MPIPTVQMECFEESGVNPWRYCLNKSENFNPEEILYYFHGRSGSEKCWNDESYYTAEILEHWKRIGKWPPLVVSISLGKLWLLIDSGFESGINPYQYFLRSVIPSIELRFNQKPLRRQLMGESMGGYNALLIGLRDAGILKKS